MVKELLVDCVGVAGLCLLGYGLWLLEPWLSYSAIGGLMIAFSYKASR